MTKLFIIPLLFFGLCGDLAHAGKPKRTTTSTPETGLSPLARIYSIENQRLANDPFLLSALHNTNVQVVKAAILAAGRIGDPNAVIGLSQLLNKPPKGDPKTRIEIQQLAAFSLGLIGGDFAQKNLEQQVQWQREPELRTSLFLAIGRCGSEKSLKVISNAILKEENAYVVEGALQALGFLWSGASEKWETPEGLIARLIQLSRQREPIGVMAALALSRYKGPLENLPKNELLAAATSTQSSYARAILLRVFGKFSDTKIAAFLVTTLAGDASASVAVEAAKALANQPPSDFAQAALRQSLSHSSTKVVIAVLEAIQILGESASSLADAVEQTLLQSNSNWIKQSALKSLSAISPAIARPRVLEALKAPSSPLYSAAISSLAILAGPEDVKKLETLLPKISPRAMIELVDVLFQWKPSDFRETTLNILKERLNDVDVGMTSQIAGLVEKFGWKEFANTLAGNYQLFTAPDTIEAKIAILTALGKVGTAAQLPLLESALNDSDKLIVTAAVKSIKALTGKDESAKIPLNTKTSGPLPPYFEAVAATQKEVVLKTNRGEIHLKMRKEAPITAYHFIKFVRSGFYDGKTFHRIVPNFVVQGGDPRGDGFGGPGFLIRDEVSPRHHLAGMVGVATAGKDTGGCQFFFNLTPNIHLYGRYTVFAEVTKGMEIVDALEIGDTIISSRVK